MSCHTLYNSVNFCQIPNLLVTHLKVSNLISHRPKLYTAFMESKTKTEINHFLWGKAKQPNVFQTGLQVRGNSNLELTSPVKAGNKRSCSMFCFGFISVQQWLRLKKKKQFRRTAIVIYQTAQSVLKIAVMEIC